jgi:hypothetical protein
MWFCCGILGVRWRREAECARLWSCFASWFSCLLLWRCSTGLEACGVELYYCETRWELGIWGASEICNVTVYEVRTLRALS